jgi:hypothetical protein
MKIYQRSQHIVEIQYGNLANQVNDACSTYYFKPSTAKFHTLTSELIQNIIADLYQLTMHFLFSSLIS